MRSRRGFTLIELMVVVSIVALLVGVAYPSYRDQVRRSGRAEARASLLEARAREEQYFLDNRQYTNNLSLLSLQLQSQGSQWLTESGKYAISASCTGNPCLKYTLTATPLGPQAEDTACNTLTLDSQGVKSANGTKPTECW